MQILEWIRFIVGTGLLLVGLGIFVIQIFGVFKFKYVLNRMHAAAMGDTLGISFSLVGIMIFNGFNFTTLKMILIVVFLWFASPVSSHLLARLEAATNENLKEHCTVYEELSDLERELSEQKALSEREKDQAEAAERSRV